MICDPPYYIIVLITIIIISNMSQASGNLASIGHTSFRSGSTAPAQDQSITQAIDTHLASSYIANATTLGLSSIFQANSNILSGLEKLGIFGMMGSKLEDLNIFGKALDNMIKLPAINKQKGGQRGR